LKGNNKKLNVEINQQNRKETKVKPHLFVLVTYIIILIVPAIVVVVTVVAAAAAAAAAVVVAAVSPIRKKISFKKTKQNKQTKL